MTGLMSAASPVLGGSGLSAMPKPVMQPSLQGADEEEYPAGSRTLGDAQATREAIFNNVLRVAQSVEPMENARHRMELVDVGYDGPDHYSIAERKRAILEGRTLARRLRGTWVLRDKASGEEIERRKSTLANVPYMTDAGTFVNGGNEYTIGNQLRLKPGSFTRIKDNGEVEAHLNALPGKGLAHRYFLDPEKGVFNIQVSQAKIPLIPLLRTLGATDKQLTEAWGPQLFQANSARDSDVAANKLYKRFVRNGDPSLPPDERRRQLKEAIEAMEVDPEVMAATLKKPYDRLSLDAVLDTTKKLLAVSRGEAEVDDRDNMAYQTVFGPEDLFAERLAKDYGNYRRTAFNKASWAGNLKSMGPGLLTKQLESVLSKSGIAQALEEINNADVLDKQFRVTRMGEGGIPGSSAIPEEARSVQPSQLAFVDPVRTPESMRTGVDVFFSSAVRKGNDGRIYAPFRDNKTGKTVWRSPQDVSRLAVAFPNATVSATGRIPAMQGGRIRYLPKEEVDLTVPHFEKAFSPLGNMIPMKSATKGQRAAMGSRMLTQALPVIDPEAPLVRSGIPGSKGSYEEEYGSYMGALRTKKPGRVMSVDEEGIRLRYADGTEETLETYTNFPYNRKSVSGDTRVLVRKQNGKVWEGPIEAYQHEEGNAVSSVSPDTGMSAWMPITGFTKHRAENKRLYRVETKSGRHVVVTEDHSLITLDSRGELAPIYPKDCLVGRTRLPLVMLADLPTTTNLTDYAEGELFGLYLSEGHIPPSQPNSIGISVAADTRAEEVFDLLRRLSHTPYRAVGSVHFTDSKTAEFLRKEGGHLSHNKKIPDWVFTKSESFRRGLVSGYFGGDGCLWADSNGAVQLTAVSVSRRLRDGIVDLLASLDIFATLWPAPRKHLNDKWRDGYGCRVLSRHLHKMNRWFFYSDREQKLREIIKEKYRASGFELIPVPKSAVPNLYLGKKGRQPTAIYKAAHAGAVAKHRVQDYSGPYGKWGRSDILWDTIISITPVCSEDYEYVYDFSVAGSEMFAVCHGLLVHNTFLNQTPLVQPGQVVTANQLLARSNYTDDKGVTALGKNARVAYIPFRGLNFEDAIVISESFAKRMSSEHMYQHNVAYDKSHKRSKADFLSLYPGKFDKSQLDRIDENGTIRPGSIVNYGDPLILAAAPRTGGHHKVHKKKSRSFLDNSVTWEHYHPGEVTDVVQTEKGATALVKSIMPMQQGDKLCYDEATEVLTRRGWIAIHELKITDEVCTLQAGEVVYAKPEALHKYDQGGRMYRIRSQQIDLLVTDNHRMYVQKRGASEFTLEKAQDIAGRRVRYKKDGHWVGASPEQVVLPGATAKAGQAGVTTRELPDLVLPVETYLVLLGAFLADGNLVAQPDSGSYGIDITKIKKPSRAALLDKLDKSGVSYCEASRKTKVRIYSKTLWEHFRQFGTCAADKRIPPEIFDWAKSDLKTLFDWLMWGDGHTKEGRPICYTTISPQLADDVQRLCLHIGYAANVTLAEPARVVTIKGKAYNCQPKYSARIITKKTTPQVNHGHVRRQSAQEEYFIEDYDQPVYCATVPGGVLYVRRDGKPCWSGNSGRYGGKGIVSGIIPDEEVPRGPDGRPYEVLLNPLGIVTRTNPAQVVEAILGKIAEKTGEPYAVPDFEDIDDLAEYAKQEAAKHGISDLEDLVDPETERKIKGILTGNRFFMKLHHTAESKGQGRSTGGYSQDETPAKGGDTGSKRVSLLDSNALLSHGATAVLRDAASIRGQQNEDYWLAFMQGHSPPVTKVPVVYQRFVDELKAAGVNVVPDGGKMQIMAMTNKDVEHLAGNREITRGDTVRVEKGMEPVTSGLFDPALTGGHQGNSWAFIRLPEPLPNPVMEDPIRHMLGLTQKELRQTLAGTRDLNGDTGPSAIKEALDRINIPREIARARSEIAGGKKTARDQAVRKLGYLKSAQKLGLHPRDWMLDKVPVLPPRFRPVSLMEDTGTPLVADANYLYKELIDARDLLETMQKEVSDVGDERLGLYDSFKSLVGLTDPTHPKLQEKRVKGILKSVFGSSPKHGTVQRKLISSPVDMVGRAVISPNPDLDMDQVGLPEAKAWEAYRIPIVRRLRRKGLPLVEAMRAAEERTPEARRELLASMEERPVFINRAPVLHKFGVMAFWPKLVRGDVMEVSPAIVGGFNADFDGDAMQYHVPMDDDAKEEMIARMLPSKNLLSPQDFKSPMHKPGQEYLGGLYSATKAPDKAKSRSPRYYENVRAAARAYMRGEIDIDTVVRIAE